MFRYVYIFILAVGVFAVSPAKAQHAATTASRNAVVEQSASDLAVQEQLREALSVLETTRPVVVEVRAGIVILRGTVQTPRARTTAETIAEQMPGILHVQNVVIVDEPEVAPEQAVEVDLTTQDDTILAQLTSVFQHIEALKSIEVNVRAGVVRLQGTTITNETRVQAAELAQSIEGVVFVDNQVTVVTDVTDRLRPTLERIVDFALTFVVQIPIFLVAIIVLILFWYLSKIFIVWNWPFSRMKTNPLLANIWRQVLRTVVFVGGIVIVLDLLGATTLVGAVVGTAGIVGLAVGFAFRDIVENYLASIILSFRKPFNMNDLVEVDKNIGVVSRMTTSETVLITPEGTHLRIPNATVFKSIISNYTRNPRRRFAFSIRVDIDQNLQQIQRYGVEAIAGVNGVLSDPAPVAIIDKIENASVEIIFWGWINQRESNLERMKSEAIRHVKHIMRSHEIALQVPMQRLTITDSVGQTIVNKEDSAEEDLSVSAVDTYADPSITNQVNEEREKAKRISRGGDNLLNNDHSGTE